MNSSALLSLLKLQLKRLTTFTSLRLGTVITFTLNLFGSYHLMQSQGALLEGPWEYNLQMDFSLLKRGERQLLRSVISQTKISDMDIVPSIIARSIYMTALDVWTRDKNCTTLPVLP
jgi:hypothetical protein